MRLRPIRALSSTASAVPIVVPIVAPVAALGVFAWQRRWVTDDAFIDLRVVRDLLDGYGPVFNVGERVEAYSNPLWVGLLALGGLACRSLDSGPALEWIAVWLGLLFTLAGLVAAQIGAFLLARRATSVRLPAFALPLGVLTLVPLSAQWDFTTSGLETGLTTGWLGVTFLAVAARPLSLATAALAGLGPLIRPDLAVYSLGWLLALLAHASPLGLARCAPILGAGLLLPAVYQLFRMGYFAALFPNTALAKEAGLAHWDQGAIYLADFTTTYRLWVPLAALAVVWLVLLARLIRHRRWPDLRLALAPVVCGLLHAAYVTRAGGDFMHGRLLLPALFTLVLPVAAVAVAVDTPREWLLPGLSLLVLLPWSAIAAQRYRPPYFAVGDGVGPQGIADERTFYVQFAGHHPHPITLADYARGVWPRDGRALGDLAAQPGTRVLFPTIDWLVERGPHGPPPESPLDPSNPSWLDPRIRVVAHRNNVGLTGYAAGSAVHLVDHLGLADPLAARLRLDRRRRPGHEKQLPSDWVLARFAPIGPASHASPSVAAAYQSLVCPTGGVATLLDAITLPLTWSRFWQNVALAPRLTALRFSSDPLSARAELCR